MQQYTVTRIPNNAIKITGTAGHDLWKEAVVLNEFKSPWDSAPVSPIEFRALHDTKNLYFSFRVYDEKVHIDTTDDSDESIGNSDRVELFFRADAQLNPYFCLEMDPTPRVMDFKAKYQRNFDFNWNWPASDFQIQSVIENDHFVVEGAISIASLSSYGLLKNGKIETGIYRAKFNEVSKGNYEPTWITWVDPKTPEPDFHLPASFGVLELEGL